MPSTVHPPPDWKVKHLAPSTPIEPLAVIPINHAAGHLVTLEATVSGAVKSRFIFDTGIGPTVISSSLASRVDAVALGTDFKGKRMSGQELSLPLAILDSVNAGGVAFDKVVVAIFDIFSDNSSAPLELRKIGGFVSPALFQDIPFTWNYNSGRIVLESQSTMEAVRSSGRRVPMKVKREGPSVQLMVELELPSGKRIYAEVDTGSSSLILDRKLMGDLGLSKEIRKESVLDETGRQAERLFASLSGSVCLSSDESIVQVEPPVMFQDIIYDALLGVDFLSRFAVTFDISGSEMIFNIP